MRVRVRRLLPSHPSFAPSRPGLVRSEATAWRLDATWMRREHLESATRSEVALRTHRRHPPRSAQIAVGAACGCAAPSAQCTDGSCAQVTAAMAHEYTLQRGVPECRCGGRRHWRAFSRCDEAWPTKDGNANSTLVTARLRVTMTNLSHGLRSGLSPWLSPRLRSWLQLTAWRRLQAGGLPVGGYS